VTDENCAKTVTIIGAGLGGLYLIAELGVAGFKLRLHDIDDSKLSEIRGRGGVDVEGEKGGFAPVERATTDLEPATDGADVIIVVTGGNAQAVVARSLAPLLRDGQVILLIQGNTGGSLIVRRALDDAGCRAEVDIAEMDNYPYSCWRLSPTRIRPIVRKRWLQIATFPGNRIGEVFPRLSPLFPEAVAAPNCLYTGFTNANAMLHVANCVANAGRIESGDSYKFYAEGVTPGVARLYEAINAERVAVAAALGAFGSDAGRLVRTRLRCSWGDARRDLPAAHLQQRWALSGDRNAEVARSQIHHRRRPDRLDPDERTGCGDESGNACDRRAYRDCPKHDRQ
jgi:opine dehydrogenase